MLGATFRIIISMISTTTNKAGFFIYIFFIQFPVPITPGGITALISTNSVILLINAQVKRAMVKDAKAKVF